MFRLMLVVVVREGERGEKGGGGGEGQASIETVLEHTRLFF